MWEIAAASLDDDVIPDSEERCERTRHRASAHCDSLVGRDGRKDIVSGGVVMMGGVEELSALFWETLLEMERFYCRAGEKDQGAITLVLDLAKASGCGQSPSCVGVGDTFPFSLGRSCV